MNDLRLAFLLLLVLLEIFKLALLVELKKVFCVLVIELSDGDLVVLEEAVVNVMVLNVERGRVRGRELLIPNDGPSLIVDVSPAESGVVTDSASVNEFVAEPREGEAKCMAVNVFNAVVLGVKRFERGGEWPLLKSRAEKIDGMGGGHGQVNLVVWHPAFITGFPQDFKERLRTTPVVAHNALNGPFVGLVVQQNTELAFQSAWETLIIVRDISSWNDAFPKSRRIA
ncbi:hypothetical protein B0H19DRAFT_1076246 [Mycena capillaripes]|nr:hypothetical protein B0H19DRAFT_1076246 [Mycena capillaripes]